MAPPPADTTPPPPHAPLPPAPPPSPPPPPAPAGNTDPTPATSTWTIADTTPTTLFSDGFESGNFFNWSVVRTGADGSAIVQNSIVENGVFAARLSETSATGSFAYARA